VTLRPDPRPEIVIVGYLVACIGLLAILLVLAVAEARSEDRATWFRSLKQPGTGMSCCDISDCRRTEAEFRDGQWHAIVNGDLTPIPPEKVLHDKPSIDGDAYVCHGTATIYCFVPPTMAM
jgi:hypothetical protein